MPPLQTGDDLTALRLRGRRVFRPANVYVLCVTLPIHHECG